MRAHRQIVLPQSIEELLLEPGCPVCRFLKDFKALRLGLGFYISCLNLREKLAAKEEPFCLPTLLPATDEALRYQGIYDVA